MDLCYVVLVLVQYCTVVTELTTSNKVLMIPEEAAPKTEAIYREASTTPSSVQCPYQTQATSSNTRGNSMPHVHPKSHVLNEIIRPIQELRSPHFLQ